MVNQKKQTVRMTLSYMSFKIPYMDLTQTNQKLPSLVKCILKVLI